MLLQAQHECIHTGLLLNALTSNTHACARQRTDSTTHLQCRFTAVSRRAQVQDKSRQLIEVLSGAPKPAAHAHACLTLASRVVSQCEGQVRQIGSFAFPLAYVCVAVGAAVPGFMELLLAKLQKVRQAHQHTSDARPLLLVYCSPLARSLARARTRCRRLACLHTPCGHQPQHPPAAAHAS